MKEVIHNININEIIRIFQTDTEAGISSPEAESRLQKYGPNKIQEEKKKSIWLVFIEQFKSPIVYLLFLATALSFYFEEWLDGSAILVVILVNGLIGFYMEVKAAKSMDALKKLSTVTAKVKRDGKIQELDSELVVPGDIIYLEAGDIIPADARIFSLVSLQTDESTLTGESTPCDKNNVSLPDDIPLAERSNLLFKGTFVTKGNTFGIVTSTGMATEIGKIAKMLQGADSSATPLEAKLLQFTKRLIQVTVFLIGLIFVLGLWEGRHFLQMLETSIALAVAAIPEGLPIVSTLALAQGMLRMAKHDVIVKKLSAVETLGGTNVICTDKTGTLTQNKIEVVTIVTPDGSFDLASNWTGITGISRDILLQVSILCNTAEIDHQSGSEKEIGDPLETGLLKFAERLGSDPTKIRKMYPKIGEIPFDSDTKIMLTLHRNEEGNRLLAKGAAEVMIQKSKSMLSSSGEKEMANSDSKSWLDRADEMASSGLKVIGFAYSDTKRSEIDPSSEFVFAGLVGLKDPPRPEVYSALEECKTAGIKVIMITGDHPFTAKNIALELGITDPSSSSKVILGKDMPGLKELTQEQKQDWIGSNIFARVSPKQKLDLVTVLQENKFIVGMTGDGVNDAPALKKADIGIAMGERGTQVAQEASDMVLKNDSFSSITVAIRQGRAIFENIRKFVIYLLSCNLSELLVISFASILNLHFQLFPLQILFINLITDVLPALALGVTEAGPKIMDQPPRPSSEPIIDSKRWKTVFIYSFLISLFSLSSVFISHYTVHRSEAWNPELCNNILFFTLIFSQTLHAFNMGSGRSGWRNSEILKNRYLWISSFVCIGLVLICIYIPVFKKALDIHEMTFEDWSISIGFSLFSFCAIQIFKKLKLVTQ
ncbi:MULTISPECIES: cation-translocating P-type ATPase [unclassified Leptospira]|uniref:cation-translocating P-type ATPase n=1 Tax=unclassified Leptospira TaxID=2633828 RepID=UPI0002BD67E3|nr:MULTISPECIES: cation-translocating P-type ATPase [unclassified Leptospira]EMK00475.1 putative calcium-translocating P-type ATPase, PMCA-type [Leptospira sp. B5-022]MCR1793111.1 cation-translocating P-type ATPase [Leptospira sp. id769339]